MKVLPAVLALVAAIASTAAAAPTGVAFDLVCSGTETPVGSAAAKPDSRRYTLDLAAKRWCRTTECTEGLPIELVTADEITFVRSAPNATLEHRHFITRASGEYVETIGGLSRTTGTCKRAPFTGFPKAKF